MTQPGGVAEHPISLIDLYPSLVDLCGLKGETRKNENGAPLDGYSVRPFLEDPENGKWDDPDAVLTLINADENAIVDLPDEDYNNPAKQHWSVRTQRWRYIRYNNGMEELYDHDHDHDPNEWANLADSPEHAEIKKKMEDRLIELRGPDNAFPAGFTNIQDNLAYPASTL